MKKKTPSKKSSPSSLTEYQKSQLNRIRSKGIFEEALRATTFDPIHPNQVDLRIRFSLYNPMTQKEEKLPGKEIELLVSSFDEVEEMNRIITRALVDWVQGTSPYK